MLKEEVRMLLIKKEKENKPPSQIKKEINNINQFQMDIKSQTKEIIRLNKIIKEKDNKINKLEKELFNLRFEEDKNAKN
jgi:predicted RNase H-like nuclease (RuvC/YqgF family)